MWSVNIYSWRLRSEERTSFPSASSVLCANWQMLVVAINKNREHDKLSYQLALSFCIISISLWLKTQLSLRRWESKSNLHLQRKRRQTPLLTEKKKRKNCSVFTQKSFYPKTVNTTVERLISHFSWFIFDPRVRRSVTVFHQTDLNCNRLAVKHSLDSFFYFSPF